MKPFLLLLLALTSLPALSQVDTLHSKAAIEAYLKRKYHYKAVKLNEVNLVIKDSTTVRAAHPEYWLKADFNHDGKADLFITASINHNKRTDREALFILASDHNHYTKVDIVDHSSNPFGYSKTSYSTYAEAGRDYLVMSSLVRAMVRLERKEGWAYKFAYNTTHDTMYVLNAKPMIYATHRASQVVESIEFSTTQCYGTCPVFQLTIKKDGAVSYKGIEFVARKGDFNLRMTPADLTYLTTLLAAINIPLLKDDYEVSYTDAQTAYLTVKYADGQTKKIMDYGLQGTYGLATLYRFLYSLRKF